MVEIVFHPPETELPETAIDVPEGSPPIAEIISAEIFRGSNGSAAASKVDTTATKVDANTIKLDVYTYGRDLLVLRYIPVGRVLQA